MILSLPEQSKYEIYNSLSGLTASMLGTATLATLIAVSLVPLFVGIPLILMTSMLSLASINNVADKIKKSRKKRVTWAETLEKHYYPKPEPDKKERNI